MTDALSRYEGWLDRQLPPETDEEGRHESRCKCYDCRRLRSTQKYDEDGYEIGYDGILGEG